MNKINYLEKGLLLLILFTPLFVMLYFFSDFRLKNSIKSYDGEGEISFIDGPLLGVSGTKIIFQEFNLGEEISKSYNISGIPLNFGYGIFFVVKNADMTNEILEIKCDFAITVNKKTIYSASSEIKNMINAYTDGYNRFYIDDVGHMNIIHPSKNKELVLRCSNNAIKESIYAYIELASISGK
jgi:hypothetical protein